MNETDIVTDGNEQLKEQGVSCESVFYWLLMSKWPLAAQNGTQVGTYKEESRNVVLTCVIQLCWRENQHGRICKHDICFLIAAAKQRWQALSPCVFTSKSLFFSPHVMSFTHFTPNCCWTCQRVNSCVSITSRIAQNPNVATENWGWKQLSSENIFSNMAKKFWRSQGIHVEVYC